MHLHFHIVVDIVLLCQFYLFTHSVWNEIVTSCVELASFNARDVIRQLEYAGVTYVQGFASFADGDRTSSSLVVTTDSGSGGSSGVGSISTLNAKKILIATGSTPFRPGGIPFDGKRIFDSDSINTLNHLPRSVAITGSGIIAIEFAKIFKNLGSEVTLIIRDNIPRNALMKIGLDKDIAATLVADLVSSFMQLLFIYTQLIEFLIIVPRLSLWRLVVV